MEQQIYRRRVRRRVVVLVIVFILTCVFIMGLKVDGRGTGNNATVQKARQQLQKNEDYPPILEELLNSNPETAEFVLNYDKESGKSHEIDLTNEIHAGEIPLFIQWDKRWGYEYYGNEMMAVDGCGPTSLAMVLAGLTQDAKWSPLEVARFAEENGFYVEGSGSSWDLMTTGASMLGASSHEVSLDASVIRNELEAGHPIICIMGPGDFTTSGHFIVLTGVNEDGTVRVNDSYSRINSDKSWNLEDIMPQMRNLWVFEL